MQVFKGKVQPGEGQASVLFLLKTANLTPVDKSLSGVYCSTALLRQKLYESITFVGTAHLAQGKPWRMETHLLDYGGPDFYDEEITVTLKKKLREVMEFTSTEQAKSAIDNDLKQARAFFA